MSYRPYVELPDQYRSALHVASKRAGCTTNAEYIRRVLTERLAEDAPGELPDEVVR
jgi:hypothetical protein